MGKLYGWMRQSKAPAYIFTALMTLLYIGIVCLAAYTFGGIVDLSDETTQLLCYAIVFVSGAICFKELSDMFYEMCQGMFDETDDIAAFRYKFVFRNIRRAIIWCLLFALICLLINLPTVMLAIG